MKLRLRLPSGPHRLDKALIEELRHSLPGLSRARLKELFNTSRVLLDGRPAEASLAIGPGVDHEVELLGSVAELAAPAVACASPRGCFLPVVHEDEEILVLDKTSGTPSVP